MFEICILIAGVIGVPLYFYLSEVSLRLKCKHTFCRIKRSKNISLYQVWYN